MCIYISTFYAPKLVNKLLHTNLANTFCFDVFKNMLVLPFKKYNYRFLEELLGEKLFWLIIFFQ